MPHCKPQLICFPLGHLLAGVGDQAPRSLVWQAAGEHADGKLWVQRGCMTESKKHKPEFRFQVVVLGKWGKDADG